MIEQSWCLLIGFGASYEGCGTSLVLNEKDSGNERKSDTTQERRQRCQVNKRYFTMQPIVRTGHFHTKHLCVKTCSRDQAGFVLSPVSSRYMQSSTSQLPWRGRRLGCPRDTLASIPLTLRPFPVQGCDFVGLCATTGELGEGFSGTNFEKLPSRRDASTTIEMLRD
jgi:hypothetical protein